MRKIVIVLTALLSLAGSAAAQRLPGNVVPAQYTLWLAPDLQNATFRGRETIQVEIKNPTAAVTLNAAEIQFGDVTVTAGGRAQTPRGTLDEKNETAPLTGPRALPKGNPPSQITL